MSSFKWSFKWSGIETAPVDTYIIIIGNSGYRASKYQACVGKYCTDKEAWVDHAGDRCSESGLIPIKWTDI